MTKDEAIAWAVAFIEDSLAYEYYRKLEDAERTVAAMTALTGKPWEHTTIQGIEGHWVIPTPNKEPNHGTGYSG